MDTSFAPAATVAVVVTFPARSDIEKVGAKFRRAVPATPLDNPEIAWMVHTTGWYGYSIFGNLEPLEVPLGRFVLSYA